MKILITGAAGNLGSLLSRHLLGGPHQLRLMVHRAALPFAVDSYPTVSLCRADLANPDTLSMACEGIDCIVHFAGVLFAPRPEKFLYRTNVEYVRNLVAAALEARVGKFILISFPHVEGESSPQRPASGRMDGRPSSLHAQTRLAAEKLLLEACQGAPMVPIVLRPGMIYARGVLMIDAARWLLARRLLAVWRQPTWIHLLSLPDFLQCCSAAIDTSEATGIYNLGDARPLTLQEFLDAAADHWGLSRPWRYPRWSFYLAGACCEAFAWLMGTASPLTRDFIKIGMASYFSDTSRQKELLPRLAYPSLQDGLTLLDENPVGPS